MKDQKGFSLIGVLIALALLGIIAAGFLSALGTASKALFTADERETAKNLAESQMEYVKEQAYAISYSAAPIPSEYTDSGYSVTDPDTFELATNPPRLQRIRVTVYHNGNPIITSGNFTLEGYKVDR